MKRNHGIRSSRVRLAGLLGAAGIAVGVVGCASPPSQPDIQQMYDQRIFRATQLRDRMLADCQTDECRNNVHAWYQGYLQRSIEAYDAALQENWRDAYDRRKALDEELYDLIPSFPELEFEDLVNPLRDRSSIDLDLTGEPVVVSGCDVASSLVALQSAVIAVPPDITQQAFDDAPGQMVQVLPLIAGPSVIMNRSEFEQVVSAVPRCKHSTYYMSIGGDLYAVSSRANEFDFSGTYEVNTGTETVAGTLSFSMDLMETLGSDGTYTADIIGGSGTFNMGPSSVALAVSASGDNTIDIGPGGNGWIEVTLLMSHSMVEWNAILPGQKRVKLPIQRSNGELSILLDGVMSDAYVPYLVHPASDYDGDGVLDFNLDVAAFMIDFNAGEYRADINADGVWDTADIDAWTARFHQDLAEMGG